MSVITLHRNPGDDPNSVRVVADGFRLSTFLLAPAALLAARLWIAFLAWLVVVGALVSLAIAGWLSPAAALLAVAIVHAGFALDMPDLERRRLQRRGWTMQGLVGPLGMLRTEEDNVMQPAGTATAPRSVRPDVLGLFPDAR